MATLKGTIRDKSSGAPVAAKVHILTSGGRFVHPSNHLLKVGPGDPFFYADGDFSVNVPRGATDIIVERGTEYEPLRHRLSAPAKGNLAIDLELQRWTDLPAQHWYPGNTHIHYDELEDKPDQRLRLDPQVNDLSVTAVSVLQRGQIPYAINNYPIGFMTDFSTDHRQVDCGEETRHNGHHGGYGHVMLLNLRNLVEPVSRGNLVGPFDPDYPPLCYACDDAKTQGGIVIWCHNGRGMEAPVAAALGKLDAFNLFDPCWKDLEYDIWYRLLNCGLPLPASTGSDWYVCSNNRVYVQTDQQFSYKSWLEGLQAGRTFITNGPALFFEAAGQRPGQHIQSPQGKTNYRAPIRVAWRSFYPLDRIEIVRDGQVIDQRDLSGTIEPREGNWSVDIPLEEDGWLAARAFGAARDSFAQAIYAHTSPIYIGAGLAPSKAAQAAQGFARGLEESSQRISRFGRFTKDEQRQEVLHLFEAGRKVYAGLEKSYQLTGK